ncbi:hypothetical protein [uncultured Desulfovibrio sp.]|uniref:hypothetical protein n=1 Tax=uncultured Desulfovibrio sp. TaxID=167968 RepID=UPI00262D7C0D|nr:hypothetical protein [uncultured Desulfovibrio sp.]
MPEIMPCPECGDDECLIVVHELPSEEWSVHCGCGHAGRYCASEEDAIKAHNALPRMSTIIAWQFQAAGAALALQRLMDAANAMREAQQAYEQYGSNEDSVTEAEASFDGLLADVRRNTLNFVK